MFNEKSQQQLIDEVARLTEKVQELENLERINQKLRSDIGIKSLNEILDNIQDTVIITNNQLEPVYTSPSCKKVTGHDLSHYQGKTVLDFVHPDDLSHVIRNAAETGKEKTGRKIEYRFRHADGYYLWVETAGSLLLDEAGKIRGAIFVGRDISDRKKIEEALLKSEAKYRTIFENTGTSVVFVEDDFTISLVNKEFERLSGYRKEDVMGKKKIIEFFPAAEVEIIKKYHELRKVSPEDVPRSYELRFVKSDGSIRDILIAVVFIPGTTTSLASASDITGIKRAQEDLRLANEVFVNSSAGIVIADHNGVIQRVNPAFTFITGFSEEEAVGRDSSSLFPDIESDQKSTDIYWTLNDGPQYKSVRWTRRKNGEYYLESSITTAIRDDKDQIVQLVKSFQDITVEEKLREEGQRIKEQAEMAWQMTEIITFLPDPTMVIDTKGRVIAWNKAMEGLTGITAEQILGKAEYEYSLFFWGCRRPMLVNLVIEYDEENSQKYFNFVQEGDCLIGEAEILDSTGKKVSLWGKASPLYDSENRIIGAIESIRDITGIRTTEKKLQESNEKYSKLIQKSSDAIFIVDTNSGLIIEANTEAERLSRYRSKELINQHYSMLNPQETPKYEARFRELLKSEEEVYGNDQEIILVTKQGTRVPIEIKANVVDIGGERIIQAIIRDITERIQKEQERVNREVDHATKNAQEKIVFLKKVVAQQMGFSQIGFFSEPMKVIFQQAQKYFLDRTIPVLIEGETGTGKEVIAKLIHYGDMEAVDKPFIDINCAAISPTLFESELFGYEAGSYTGGLAKGQQGKLDIAYGGTLFLDEISELPIELQSKLLRVIQEKQFYRVGGLRKVKTDIRFICATNIDLNAAVEEGRFRKDLYYRLKVGFIRIPPLRERKDDILPLAHTFLIEISRQKGKSFMTIDTKAAEVLFSYHWPGNVRELRNVIEWAVFMHNDTVLKSSYLEFIQRENMVNQIFSKYEAKAGDPSERMNKTFNSLVDELLYRTLQVNKGNISKTARSLGISRTTLYKRINNFKNSGDI